MTYCLVTDGDAGGFDDTPRAAMPALHRAEQIAAAAVLGVTDVRFLGYPDGRVYATHELRRDISRVIRQVRPQRVLTQSPDRVWARLGASHPDHRATGEATINAVYPDARNPFAHPELLADEGLEPWTVRELWLMASPTPDHYVDVTDTVDHKLAALREHVSQTTTWTISRVCCAIGSVAARTRRASPKAGSPRPSRSSPSADVRRCGGRWPIG